MMICRPSGLRGPDEELKRLALQLEEEEQG